MSEHESVRKRAQSVTRAEKIQEQEQKVRKKQPDRPCHKPRDSLFSWASGFDNFTGFVNWAFLLLTIGGLRLLLENFIKYGIRIDPVQWLNVLMDQDESAYEHPSLVLVLYHVVPVVMCLLTEKALAVEIISTGPGMLIHIINLLVLILLPMIVIHLKEGVSLVGASCVCMIYSLLFLKLWSYVQVNMWCRTAKHNYKGNLRRQSLSHSNLKSNTWYPNEDDYMENHKNHKVKLVQYPDNLNLKDLYYFLFAPTLCYELNFPRTERIRKRFLMRRILEVLIGGQIILMVMQQYMVPSVKNSLIPFSNLDYMKTTERLLKLAIPNHFTWLCGFYILFHSWLNLIGELLHFADRSFYNDWWNAENIDVFWRNWNLPVHRWALRHLYFPMVEMGYSKSMGSMAVFFISAFFHEYMLQNDLENYVKWKLVGGRKLLKKDVIPHRFYCQADRKISFTSIPRQTAVKKGRLETIQAAEKDVSLKEELNIQVEKHFDESTSSTSLDMSNRRKIGVQTNIKPHDRSKLIQCELSKIPVSDSASSPFISKYQIDSATSPIKSIDFQKAPRKKLNFNTEGSSASMDTGSSSSYSVPISSLEISDNSDKVSSETEYESELKST